MISEPIDSVIELAVSFTASIARRGKLSDSAAGATAGGGATGFGATLLFGAFFGAGLGGAAFAGAFTAGAFLAGAFLAGAFLAGAFFAGAFLAGAFLAGAFFAAERFAGLRATLFFEDFLAVFLGALFFAAAFFAGLREALRAGLRDALFFDFEGEDFLPPEREGFFLVAIRVLLFKGPVGDAALFLDGNRAANGNSVARVNVDEHDAIVTRRAPTP